MQRGGAATFRRLGIHDPPFLAVAGAPLKLSGDENLKRPACPDHGVCGCNWPGWGRVGRRHPPGEGKAVRFKEDAPAQRPSRALGVGD